MKYRQEKNTKGLIIEANGLALKYPNIGGNIRALRNASLVLEESEFVCIFGPSGCGKSTLFNVLGCLCKPDEGTLSLFGKCALSLSSRERSYLLRNDIAFVFQAYNLFPTMTALENVAYPMMRARQSHAKKEAMRLLESVGLGHVANAKPNCMSGGEQQRTALARAFSMSPRLILADEPTGALDNENAVMVFKSLRNYCEEKQASVVVISHDETSRHWAHRTLFMNEGAIYDTKK